MNTTDSNMPRRRFLAAGAVLAASALLRPSSSANASTIQPATDAELWAILDRRIYASHRKGVADCRCGGCDTVRAQPFTCPACGFQGEPIVFPCDCTEQWDDWTSANENILSSGTLSAKDRAEIEAFQARLLAAGRPTLCDVRDSVCAHGSAVCPACGDSGNGVDPFECEGEPRELAALLRDLRAALRTRAVT